MIRPETVIVGDTTDGHQTRTEAEASVLARVDQVVESRGDRDETEILQLLDETLSVSKRQVVTGHVTVTTRTEVRDEVAEIALNRHHVDVTRVPVGRIVEGHPTVRTEGDTTIVPVVEERYVVVKQIYLKEELHIRHIVEREVVTAPVQLRRQHAVIERQDIDGLIVEPPTPGKP